MSYIDVIWNYKLSLVPVLLAYAIFEIPTVIRRVTRVLYTPIYFVFFPLGHADELYAQYFNEDDFYGVGACQTPTDKAQVRNRILIVSGLSMIFATVVSPFLAGVFTGTSLTGRQFTEFLWTLIAIKAVMVSWSLYNARYVNFISVSAGIWPLACIYVVYLVVIARVLISADAWTRLTYASGGLGAVVLGAFDFMIFKVGIEILVVAVITVAVTRWFTKPENIPPPQLFVVTVEESA